MTLDPIAHAALSNAALNSPHPNAKPLRIAVWLGDGGMQSALSHAQTDVSKLQQLMACRIQLDVEDKPLIDEPSDEPTLVALITEQLVHIAQKQLVEIRFDHQQQVRCLYLLDGLLAAQLHLHAEAYISALTQTQAEANEALCDIEIENCANRAFALAKRNPAQAVNCYAEASNLACQLNVLAQAVEALSHRSLKGIAPRLDAAQLAEQQAEKPVKTAENGYWFTKPHQARVLSLNLLGNILGNLLGNLLGKAPQAQTAQSLILTQGTRLIAQPLLNANRLLIPISGNTLESLTAKLSQLIDSLDLSACLPDTNWLSTQGSDWFKRYQAKDELALVLMAGSLEELMQEAKAMQTFIEKARLTIESSASKHCASKPSASTSLVFKTPAGSYFTPTPLGDTGLTFVYPGVGTVYPNMFSDLHGYFPELYRELEREGDLAAMLQAEAIYQSAAYAKSAVDVKDAAEMSLSQLAISGVGASYLFTQLLTRVFTIQPRLAMGYSMGEAAMWTSLDIWQTPHALINATQNSTIFNQEISGPLLAVRRDWKLSDNAPLVWNSFLVRATSAEINPLLADFPQVYLAIEQGDTCIIAGCEASCLQLLTRLNKRGIASNKVTAMHTSPSQSQHSAIQRFYTLGLKATACETQVRFISAAQQSAVSIDSQSIAKSIADTFCAPLNFTALINTAYHQGARLFVEVGADRQTSTLIDKISRQLELGADSVQEPILAMACNAKGSDTITSLLKCLAQLISHRVPLSLAPLMPQSAAQSVTHSATIHADKTAANTITSHSANACALGHFSNVFQEGEPQ